MLRRFAGVIATNAALLALFSLIQALTWNGKIYWYYPSPHADSPWSGGGPFVSHTHLAEYLNIGLGFSLGLVAGLRRSDYTRRAWVAYLVGVIVLGVVTSHSRGGFLAMLLAVGLTACLSWTRGKGYWIGLLSAVALLVVFLASLGTDSPYMDRLSTILDSNNEGYAGRIAVWKDSVRAWRSHPILGTGLGTFHCAALPFVTQNRGKYFVHAENEYVEMLVDGGCVGIGIALAGVTALAFQVRRTIRGLPATADRALVLGGCVGVAAIALQCLGDFGLHIPGVSIPLVVTCALICRDPSQVAPVAPRRERLWMRVAEGNVIGLVAVVVVFRALILARAESTLLAAGIVPDIERPALVLTGQSPAKLRQNEAALRTALALRPDWSEGYLRLGITQVALYRATAEEWLKEQVPKAADRAILADPLWLLAVASKSQENLTALLDQEPVQRHLIPAARSYLQARRSCWVSSSPQLGLASVAFLLEPTTTSDVYLRRSEKTAGADVVFAGYGAEIAVLRWLPVIGGGLLVPRPPRPGFRMGRGMGARRRGSRLGAVAGSDSRAGDPQGSLPLCPAVCRPTLLGSHRSLPARALPPRGGRGTAVRSRVAPFGTTLAGGSGLGQARRSGSGPPTHGVRARSGTDESRVAARVDRPPLILG